MRSRRFQPVRLLLLLIATIGGARPVHAQSRGLAWLAWLEEWSAEEEYRGWILHGAIAALVTYAADRIADRPEYGAAAASGFYLGKEIREAYYWDSPRLDRIMDAASPIVVSIATAYLLRGKRGATPQPASIPIAAPPCPAPAGDSPQVGGVSPVDRAVLPDSAESTTRSAPPGRLRPAGPVVPIPRAENAACRRIPVRPPRPSGMPAAGIDTLVARPASWHPASWHPASWHPASWHPPRRLHGTP